MKQTIQQKIVREIIKEQKTKPDVIAINIFGSVARGEERLDSDVDIGIISTKYKRWHLFKQKRYGIDVDFEVWPKDKLVERIQKYPFLSYCLIKEKTVYDTKGFMKNIVSKLKKYFKKHPKIVKFWERKYKLMKKNKKKGIDPKEALKTYNEAEIKFSKEHKITRNWFRD